MDAEVRDDLTGTLPTYGHVTFNWNDFGPGMNSISYRRDLFRLVSSGFERASEGRLNVAPARFVCWVVFEHIASGRRFVVINVHFTKVIADEHGAWRRQQWNRNLTVLRAVVARFRAQGLPVLVGGDLNRQVWDIVGEGLVEPRYVEPPKGPTVDRIAVSRDVTVLDSRLGPQNGSKHFSVIARLVIKE